MSKLQELTANDLDKSLKNIQYFCDTLDDSISKIVEHLINNGGKRLRPQFTLCCAKICNYHGEKHINLATVVELIHTATLLHDDVVDESSRRRNVATVNHLWGNKSAILAGDILLAYALELTTPEALRSITRTVLEVAKGEIKQLSSDKKLEISIEEYLDIISLKTAKLFSLACELGTFPNNSSTDIRKSLMDFGYNFGMAFQLIDDVLDYTSDNTGKTRGLDFQNNKITLPVILAYQRGDKEFWQSHISRVKNTSEEIRVNSSDFQKTLEIMEETNAIKDTKILANKYLENARTALDDIQNSEYKNALLETLDFYTDMLI